MADAQPNKLYRVRRTVLQMLRDRGYLVDNQDIERSEEDFLAEHDGVPK